MRALFTFNYLHSSDKIEIFSRRFGHCILAEMLHPLRDPVVSITRKKQSISIETVDESLH